jgi:hypothetical protein
LAQQPTAAHFLLLLLSNMRLLGLVRSRINFTSAVVRHPTRAFGAHGHGHGHKSSGGEFNVDEMEHLASESDTLIAKGLAVMLWLWIMINVKENKGKFLVS